MSSSSSPTDTGSAVRVAALEGLFGNRCKTEQDVLQSWGVDRTRQYPVAPSAVVFPDTVEEIIELVRLARADHFALVPSGGRTGLSGGAVASNAEVVVSLDRMNQILDVNTLDRQVHLQAGCITANLHAAATDAGLYYPVDFASSGSSQIGGNIATNAGGIRVIRYGMTRAWVAGLDVVTGSGEVMQLNQGLLKNNTGIDLRHLYIGSEGTLGIITAARMSVCAPPAPAAVMVVAAGSLSDLVKILQEFQGRLSLSAFEFFTDAALQRVLDHGNAAQPFAQRHPYYALLEFDEDDHEVAAQTYTQLSKDSYIIDAVMSQSDRDVATLWRLRENISEALAPERPYKNDVSVRIEHLDAFVRAADELLDARFPEVEVVWFGHIGDGNLHINVVRRRDDEVALSDDRFMEICADTAQQLFQLVQRFGGSVSAEHGVGLLKRDYLSYSRSDAELAAMRGIRAVLDPDGVMNPGKVLR